MKEIITESVVNYDVGMLYKITEDHITQYVGRDKEYESKGNLVRSHFLQAEGLLYVSYLLKHGKVKEAMEQYHIGDKEREEYEQAATLDKCLNALEKLLQEATEGRYDSLYEEHAGGDNRYNTDDLEQWSEMQDVYWHILDLRNGRWHGSGNIRYEGRRGIPRIETIGERLYDDVARLIWRLDGGDDYMSDAMRRWEEISNSVIPDVDIWDDEMKG